MENHQPGNCNSDHIAKCVPVQFSHLLDSLLALVFTIDKEGFITYSNHSFFTVFGYAPEEIAGNNILKYIAESDQNKTKDYLNKQVSGQNILHFENLFVHKDGWIVPISWAGRWDEKDQLLYCVARDITARREIFELQGRFEREVKKQNRQMLNMLDRITDGFFVLDSEWRFIYANNSAQQIAGISVEEVLTKTIWECFPDLKGSEPEILYQKVMREKVPVSFELYSPEPINKWIKVNAYPSESGISVFFSNITEQKRIEKERAEYEQRLSDQNNRLNETLERITDAFYAVDKDWNITYWNKGSEEITSMARESVVGKNLWKCLPKTVGTIVQSNFQKSFDKQEPVFFQAPSTLGPMLLDFSVHPSKNGLTVFYRDITEKRKLEDEMIKLSLIVKETDNAVSLIEPDGKISWINEAYTKITGYSKEEATGQQSNLLLRAADPDNEKTTTIHDMLAKCKPFKKEIIAYTRNKERKWLYISAQPMFDKENKLQQHFIILTDITERKSLELELEEQRKKINAAVLAAQEKERAEIGRELHDNINQVLTTAKLYVELGRDGAGNSREVLNKSIYLLQDSINEIRNLSKRLSAPSLGNIKLSESVKELIDNIIATNKIKILLDVSGLENIVINYQLHMAIYRILQEHVTNVLKHAQAENLSVLINCIENKIQMDVKDDGKGFILNGGRNGIGITNMITRAEALNGTFSIKSAPGMGCKLMVEFPLN